MEFSGGTAGFNRAVREHAMSTGRAGGPKTHDTNVAISAAAFGYGPAAKALAVAGKLVQSGCSCRFVGEGVAFELASRSSDFVECIEAGPSTSLGRSVLSGSDAVVVSMDPGFCRESLDLDRELFVIDSLFWMWDAPPKEFLAARKYYVQNFPGVPERLSQVNPMPTLVGPIIGGEPRGDGLESRPIIFNLGGFESPFARVDNQNPYLDFLGETLFRESWLKELAAPILCLGGRASLKYLHSRFPRHQVSFRSAPFDEARILIQNAGRVYTSPGLTTVLTTFMRQVPTFFLPPQNYSQWLNLLVLRAHGLAPASFHWGDLLDETSVREGMPESESLPMINAIVRNLATQPDARACFARAMHESTMVDAPALARDQQAFFRALGPEGAATIAEDILSILNVEKSLSVE